jgi:hypothetical protein
MPGHAALAAIRAARSSRKSPQTYGDHEHAANNTNPAKRMGALYGFPEYFESKPEQVYSSIMPVIDLRGKSDFDSRRGYRHQLT